MRMILIEVDDDQVAAALEEKFLGKLGFRVVGLFQVPKTRCECKEDERGAYDLRNGYKTGHYKRSVVGQRFGWRVHDRCGRAAGGLFQLRNLLPRAGRAIGPSYPNKKSPTYVDFIQVHDSGFYPDDPKMV